MSFEIFKSKIIFFNPRIFTIDYLNENQIFFWFNNIKIILKPEKIEKTFFYLIKF